jgi:hypothetical protein
MSEDLVHAYLPRGDGQGIRRVRARVPALSTLSPVPRDARSGFVYAWQSIPISSLGYSGAKHQNTQPRSEHVENCSSPPRLANGHARPTSTVSSLSLQGSLIVLSIIHADEAPGRRRNARGVAGGILLCGRRPRKMVRLHDTFLTFTRAYSIPRGWRGY